MKTSEPEDEAASSNLRRVGDALEHLPDRVFVAACRTWHEQDGTEVAADPAVCQVYSEVDVGDLGVIAETQDIAKTNGRILLTGDFFAREIIAGKTPPDWLVAALSEQLNRLRVDILHACPQNFADNLTPKTLVDLEPRVKELGREAKRVRRYVAGESSSHKRKDDQTKRLLGSLQVLGRLVYGKLASEAASEKIARNGDGVILNCLFEGVDTPACLPCDDDQFMLYLNVLDEHLRKTSAGDLEASLGPGKDELVACLRCIEELTNNRILVLNEHRRRSREARSVSRGRPPKKSTPPQMRCAAIIEIARQEWPEFVSRARPHWARP